MPENMEDEGMAEGVDKIARHTFTKERQCQNYRTISLTSHPSNVMLRVILNRLKAKAEELLADEQAGFRPGRSSVEQILNGRVITEKHLQHQRDLFHSVIEYKKAFDRVRHSGLLQVSRELQHRERHSGTI